MQSVAAFPGYSTLAAAPVGGAAACAARSGDGLLCAPCHAELPRLPASCCARCALPLAAGTPPGAQCGRCVAESPPYDATCAVYVYDFPADVLLQSLKFRGELALAHLFGAELAARLAGSARRRRPRPARAPHRAPDRRGYNHALEIARLPVPDSRQA
jgi:predicted amidophosphoribosyltransferase